MYIGVLQFELTIPHSESLKDKRRVVKSLKDRLHREHLISIAEVGSLDEHRTAMLAASVVAREAPRASAVLDAVVEKIRSMHDARLGSVSRHLIHESELLGGQDGPDPDDPAWADEERRMTEEAERLLTRESDHP